MGGRSVPFGRIPSGLRSGKFSLDGSMTTPVTIVHSAPVDETYRVLNSGPKTFRVVSGTRSVELRPRSSLDITIPGGTVPALQVQFPLTTNKDRYEGIFERLSSSIGVPGGRFSVTDKPAPTIPIVFGKSGTMYRILNSGPNPFRVRAAAAADIDVKSKQSVDVVVNDAIQIVPIAPDDELIGIYERLDGDAATRNGRFVIKTSATTPQTIINMSGAPTPAWYRIHNSGENLIRLVRDSSSGSSVTQELGVDLSLEFKVGEGDVVSVKSASPSARIQGIYALLNVR